MKKSTTVRAVMDPDKKDKVSRILRRMGINHSEAINIFYSLIQEYQGFPFKVRLPETEKEQIQKDAIAHLKDSMKKNHKLGQLLAQ
jgi:addiction module RelB/DinJ family antitoxin